MQRRQQAQESRALANRLARSGRYGRAPEEERKAVAEDVADWVLETLESGGSQA